MKTNPFDPVPIFRDRLLTNLHTPRPLWTQEPSDLVEAVLRILLVLCLLVSPLLCGLRATAATSASAPASIIDSAAYARPRAPAHANLSFSNASLRLP
jgi:hypothetical protein